MEEAFRSLLVNDPTVAGIVADRVAWDETPQGDAQPRIVLTLISDVGGYSYRGEDGLSRARVQVDCDAPTSAGAIALRDAVRLVLSGWRGIKSGIAFRGIFLDATRGTSQHLDSGGWRRQSMDFSVWHRA